MVQEDISFLSVDKRTKIHAVKWLPDAGEYRAILQITHGMQEYIERYQEFASFLTERGFLVVGHDHLGHGTSIVSADERGFFSEKNPSDLLVADMHKLRVTIQREHSRMPYFMLGHSMGSYMLRKYLTVHPGHLSGAIIMGTGSMPGGLMRLGMGICRSLALLHGWHYRSAFVKRLSFLGPYRRFDLTGRQLENSWLTRDAALVAKFLGDSRSGFDFTVNGYYGLMEAVYYDGKFKNIQKMPKNLPLILLSGDQDPVGNMGAGVRKVFRQYQAAGMQDVAMKLYKNDRHELLNELDRKTVYEDIYSWMCDKCFQKHKINLKIL